MDSDQHAQHHATGGAAGEETARPEPVEVIDAERVFHTVLRDGWTLIGRCRVGTRNSRDDTGCFVLAHGGIGVALVDLAPGETPNAEARLRRMLNAAGFEFRHRGFLPVMYFQVGPKEMPGFGAMLDQAFAAELPLNIKAGDAWVSTLRRMLQSGVTWEGIGRKGGALLRPGRAISRRPGGWSILPTGSAALNLAVTFGIGFLAGILCVPSSEGRLDPATPDSGIAGGTPSAIAGANPAPAKQEPSGASGRGQSEAPPGQARIDPLQPAGAPVTPPAPELSLSSAASQQPIVTESMGQIAGLPMTEGETPPVPNEAALPHEASGSRPNASHPSPRRAARTSYAIDRRCSDAVFRYQQGASLSWTEMSYIRDGCHSWR